MSKIKVINKFKYCINRNKHNKAVSEVIGSVFLLSIMVTSFSVIYMNVLSIPPPSNPSNVEIVSYIENNNLVLEHQKGEPLGLDTKITVNMGFKNETILVGNYLDSDAKKDGVWSIGERAIYPFYYNVSNIKSYFTPYVYVADIDSNSLEFIGTLDVYPETDLEISFNADDLSPSVGEKVNFTICVTNSIGGTPSVNIEILNCLARCFSYYSNVTSRGDYNLNTGIWNISYLDSGESACLIITTIVVLTADATELAMVLDGSGSISSYDWSIMREGLARSIENSSVFPHDGNVELTVIQFGGISNIWNKNWNNYASTWYRNTQQHKKGESSVKSDRSHSGYFRSNSFDTRGSDPVTVDFWYRLDDTENVDLILYYYDGSNYNSMAILGGGQEDTWLHYTGTITNSSYFISNFRIGFSSVLDSYENVWIDTIVIKKGLTLIFYDEFENILPIARSEINRNIVTSSNYHSIANQIRSINQITGFTPMSCGIRLTADLLYPTLNGFNLSKRQLINLVTDGKPNCVWIPGTNYEGVYMNDNLGKQDTVDARSYLLSTLQMNISEKDEFDSLAVGSGPETNWLRDNIVWPQPGHIAPPYAAGWVKYIGSYQEFEATIKEIFRGYFGISNSNTVKIITSTPSIDPNPEDNEMNLILDTH